MSTDPATEKARKRWSKTPAQIRNRRKREDKAYAAKASLIGERAQGYLMRKGRLSRLQRKVLRFIESPTKAELSRLDQQGRLQHGQAAIYTEIVMKAPRNDSRKTEAKRQNSIRSFLQGLVAKRTPRAVPA